MLRPSVDYKLTKRECVRFWRRQAAWDLASKITASVTEEDYKKAYSLLNRCTRWAIAQMRHDECEDARCYNTSWYKREGERLEARCKRLRDELRPYRCTIACMGYCNENVYDFDFENHVMTDEKRGHYLYFF